MSEEYTYHIADSVETMTLIPRTALVHILMMSQASGYRPEFKVCEQTGSIEVGNMIDTASNKYFTFEVFRGDNGEFDLLPTSDWQPCDREG